jgi:4-nitrophenyl phosphatase
MQTDAASRLRLVIFDLDGVVYRGDRVVAGAPELIRRVREHGLTVRFATNNSMLEPSEFVSRLAALHIAAGEDELVTSTMATVQHLRRRLPEVRHVLAVGEHGLLTLLRGGGYRVTAAAEALPDGFDGEPLDGYDAVVVGLDRSFDYRRLAAAHAAIRGGARFIATNADATYPTAHGLVPGAGTMVAAMRAACGVEPTIIGKPQPGIFLAILEGAGIDREQALVVGDNPAADIVAARRAGIASVLVLTGVADASMAAELDGERRPDAVVAGPDELATLIDARLS